MARTSDDNRSCDSSRAPRASGRARPPIDMFVSLESMSQLLLLESMGVNPLDPSSDYGASLGQPFNNDDAATQKFCSDCSESSNDEDMAAAEEALDAIAQAETQVADDYDAAEEQAGVESCLTFMLESQVPPARQLLPHTKRGQGPAEHALLSDPASPSYSPVASPPLSSPHCTNTSSSIITCNIHHLFLKCQIYPLALI